MRRVELVPIDFAEAPRTIPLLQERLNNRLRVETVVRYVWVDFEECFDSFRGQYNSTKALRLLLARATRPATKVLGITSVDLFIPVLTFVFGEAQLGGKVAIVSSHRLKNEVYGLPPSSSLLLDRMAKEATHELGHAWGLIHCRKLECVMHSSTYVEEIDLKGAGFCDACEAVLGRARG